MKLKCVDSGDFADALDVNGLYDILARGENSYLIKGKNGKERWYGARHFKIVAAG